MRRAPLITATSVLLALVALSTFAQDRPLVGTVIDVDEGRGRLQIESDADPGARITIESDSVSTSYHGFGTMIAGRPEIFTGSQGLSNVRLGDRVQVRGTSNARNVIQATQVTLIGRTVEAPPVGVGQTRPQGSVSTPTDDRTAVPIVPSGGTVEGTIRQINQEEGRLVIVTLQRRMMTVRTFSNTPVHYRGQVYRVANLEVGDEVRIEADPRDAQADDITARRIDVTRSVQEAGLAPAGGTVTMVQGRVLRVEPGLDYIYIEQPRGEVRVDMQRAEDSRGEILRARDIRVGDVVELSGSYNRVGDMFLASTVRFEAGGPGAIGAGVPFGTYSIVTLSGTIVETLEDSPTLGFRERDTERVARIWIAPNFIVRTRANTNVAAETLRVNDTVIIEAFRDPEGNLIAQTIRLRNR
jgi:hypothetical protein